MKINNSICAICGSEASYKIIYESTFDPGSDLNVDKFSARRIPDKVHGTLVRCNTCGLVRTLEIVPSEVLKNLYIDSNFTYSNETKNLQETYVLALNRLYMHSNKIQSLLEIGCGNGFFLEKAKKAGIPEVVGIEPSTDAILNASDELKPLIKQGLLEENTFGNNTFDVVCGFQVFDHIPSPNTFLEICRNIIRTDGYILLFNHNVDAIFTKILRERSPIFDIEHTYLYNSKTIKQILEKNGFEIIDLYSPFSYLSLRYTAQLIPIPKVFKKLIQNANLGFLDKNIKFKPGNLCVIAKKS